MVPPSALRCVLAVWVAVVCAQHIGWPRDVCAPRGKGQRWGVRRCSSKASRTARPPAAAAIAHVCSIVRGLQAALDRWRQPPVCIEPGRPAVTQVLGLTCGCPARAQARARRPRPRRPPSRSRTCSSRCRRARPCSPRRASWSWRACRPPRRASTQRRAPRPPTRSVRPHWRAVCLAHCMCELALARVCCCLAPPLWVAAGPVAMQALTATCPPARRLVRQCDVRLAVRGSVGSGARRAHVRLAQRQQRDHARAAQPARVRRRGRAPDLCRAHAARGRCAACDRRRRHRTGAPVARPLLWHAARGLTGGLPASSRRPAWRATWRLDWRLECCSLET